MTQNHRISKSTCSTHSSMYSWLGSNEAGSGGRSPTEWVVEFIHPLVARNPIRPWIWTVRICNLLEKENAATVAMCQFIFHYNDTSVFCQKEFQQNQIIYGMKKWQMYNIR